MLTPREVLQILKIGNTTLWRIMSRSELRAYKIENSLRFKESDVEAFIEARERKVITVPGENQEGGIIGLPRANRSVLMPLRAEKKSL